MHTVPGGFLKENLGLTVHRFKLKIIANIVLIAVE